MARVQPQVIKLKVVLELQPPDPSLLVYAENRNLFFLGLVVRIA